MKAISESKPNGQITLEAGPVTSGVQQWEWFIKGKASKRLKIQRG